MNPSPTMADPMSHWPLLDLVRGLACLAVVLFHSLSIQDIESLNPALQYIKAGTQHGWIAVHLFFVVSGWCMGERLFHARKNGESVFHFLINRALRIFPLYWFVLLLVFLRRIGSHPWNETTFSANFPPTFLAALNDLFLLYEFFPQTAYLVVAWSLGIEILFYVLCAAALFAWKLNRSGAGILAGSILLFSLFSIWSIPLCKNLIAYLPHFLWGILAWRICRIDSKKKLYFLLFFSPVAFLIATEQWTAVDAFSCLSALLLIFAFKAGFRGDSFPLWKIGVGLGTISYSWYLLHVPVLSPFMNLCRRFVSPAHPLFTLVWFLALLLSVFTAYLLYYYVEKRIEKWRKSTFPNRPQNSSLTHHRIHP
jgi:peptidoglycan/LPS O-acetylase OafA/YrhL